jgi:hypothetical protein
MKHFGNISGGMLAIALAVGTSACETPEDEDRGGLIDDGDVNGDVQGFRGLPTYNGLELGNGLTFTNGLALTNGLAVSNGLAYQNGLAVSNGLAYTSGLSSTSGYMTSEAGRKLIKYIVECALPSGDSITKGSYTFAGKVGLAPEWKYGTCGRYCQEWISACLLARTNEFGITVKIDMRANHSAIGTGPGGSEFTEQEGAFFGNLFANPPKAYACQGQNAANAYYSNRTCSYGRCAMKEVDYAYCSNGCSYWYGGTQASCWASNNPYSSDYSKSYDTVITTYLKPYWKN